MKYSRQRELILKAVQESMEHPNADMIYAKVKEDLPNISLGTVYRNLNQLYEMGQIKKIKMSNDSDRFDKTIVNHYHFYCENCHKMFDIPPLGLEQLNKTVENELECWIESQDLVFTGCCKNCYPKKRMER